MKFDHEWHVALNKFNSVGGEFHHWMYEAKNAYNELHRLPRLFKAEREGTLTKTHKQCSFSAPVELTENFLTCCLGKKCAECSFLKAIDQAQIPDPEKDIAKAATCVGHILSDPGSKDTSEGYILTEDDKMFWQNVYKNMSADGGSHNGTSK